MLLTGLPPAFFHPTILQTLREKVEAIAPIHSWAPVTRFGRIIVVFYDEEDAEKIHYAFNGLEVPHPGQEWVI